MYNESEGGDVSGINHNTRPDLMSPTIRKFLARLLPKIGTGYTRFELYKHRISQGLQGQEATGKHLQYLCICGKI